MDEQGRPSPFLLCGLPRSRFVRRGLCKAESATDKSHRTAHVPILRWENGRKEGGRTFLFGGLQNGFSQIARKPQKRAFIRNSDSAESITCESAKHWVIRFPYWQLSVTVFASGANPQEAAPGVGQPTRRRLSPVVVNRLGAIRGGAGMTGSLLYRNQPTRAEGMPKLMDSGLELKLEEPGVSGAKRGRQL